MIAWRNDQEALEYASHQLDEATDAVQRLLESRPTLDRVQLALTAITDALATLVLVQHSRRGDALVTIDQLAAEGTELTHAQGGAPRRRCCQTYIGEGHAPGCLSVRRSPSLGRA